MRIALKDHGEAGLPLARALHDAGHEFVHDGSPVDLLLIDFDLPEPAEHREIIDYFADRGAVVVQYPHGAGPNLTYDSLAEPYCRVDAQLTVGAGEKDFLIALGIDRPTYPVGWGFCPQRAFRPCPLSKRVLFGPVHPNGDGSMRWDRRAANATVFGWLLDEPFEQIVVRHLGTLEQNGLWEVPGVRYACPSSGFQLEELDWADVVVAGCGTLPTLAVARGIPTVFYQQDEAGLGRAGETVEPTARLHLYRETTHYPYDAFDAPLGTVLREATRYEATGWRENWVGEEMDGPAVAAWVENFVGKHQRVRSES